MYPTNLWRTFLSPSADLQWKLLSRRLHRGSAISIQSRHSLVKKLLYSIKILNSNFHWTWVTVDVHFSVNINKKWCWMTFPMNDLNSWLFQWMTFPFFYWVLERNVFYYFCIEQHLDQFYHIVQWRGSVAALSNLIKKNYVQIE